MLDQLTVEIFEPLIGHAFWVEFPNDTKVELQLVRASKTMESEAANLPRHPFSLLFVGPKSFQLKQHTYAIANDTLGKMHLFLVPVGETPDVFVYEVAFA